MKSTTDEENESTFERLKGIEEHWKTKKSFSNSSPISNRCYFESWRF